MTPPTATARENDAEALLAHAHWVRGLARSLVRDPHLADDLAQQTCLAALEHRPDPRGHGGLRAWLATVLKNLVRQGARSDERRHAREATGARPEAVDSTLELVERWSVHRQLVEAVDALDEPYRSTLLLRYFEELTPREIARRSGVPVATVKTRLARGIVQLRQALARERGPDGTSLLSALVPLAFKGGKTLPLAPTLGALVMSTQLKIAAALLVALVGTYALWPEGESKQEVLAEVTPPATPATRPIPAGGGAGLASNPTSNTRTAPQTAPTPAPPAEEQRATTLAPVAGRVIAADGAALVGEPVAFAPDGAGPDATTTKAVSGPQGRFTIETTSASGRLFAGGADRTTVYAGAVSASRLGVEPVVVVAPRQPLAGHVRDEQDRMLENVRVAVQLPPDFKSRLGGTLDRSLELDVAMSTGPDGAFDLPSAPFIEGARLTASLSGYEPWSQELPQFSDTALDIVLQRPQARPGTLSGLVVDARDTPVPLATVVLGLDSTRTDEHGVFTLDLERGIEESANAFVSERFGLPAPTKLQAVKAGFLPATQELVRDAEGQLVLGSPIVLTLDGKPLSIAGRVVDDQGQPLAGIEVWIADVSLFAIGMEGTTVLENLLADRTDATWHTVATDADGRFEIDGLAAREYTLEAMNPQTLLRARVEGVAAGRRDVELALSGAGLFERVSGRVVTKSGAPVANANVFPMCDGLRLRYMSEVLSTSHASVEGVRTGPDGRFELLNVPRDLAYLRVNAEDTLPVEHGRHVEGGLAAMYDAKGPNLDNVEIVVPLRVRLRVELANPAEADQVAVLDDEGQRIVINVILADGRSESEVMPLSDGKSEVLTVTDSAATLVLLAGEREVRRLPITLSRGDVNVIRP